MIFLSQYHFKMEQMIFFAKIVNWYFESKECFLAHQLRSFDGDSMRIKGAKNLYLPVVHSKHTASYKGQHLWLYAMKDIRILVKNLLWLVNQTCHQPLGQQAEKLVLSPVCVKKIIYSGQNILHCHVRCILLQTFFYLSLKSTLI